MRTVSVTGDGGGHRVTLTGVGKRYGGVRALAGVDLEVEAGGFLVLLGPSGSGKTTLVRALAGIERLDEGEMRIGDRVVSDPRTHVPPEQRDLAMVFQDYALWPHLTAVGNVGYALRRRKLAADQARERSTDALRRVGLGAELTGRYPHELSGGQQQRVALARAIVARPGLLLFDEPLSNLDTDLRERLRVEISTLTRESGATAVYITHDQSEAFALADRIGVLDGGRLVQLADPETLYRDPATPFVARFTGLSGEFTGVVAARESADSFTVDVGPWQLGARSAHELKVGDPVRVLIRPAATAFVESADVESAPGTVTGIVIDVAYRGRGYDHVVDCGEGTLTSVFALRPRSRGEHARISLDAAACIAFPLNDVAETSYSYDEEITTVMAGPEPAPIDRGVTA